MSKYTFYLLLSILFFSCDKNDNDSDNDSDNNNEISLMDVSINNPETATWIPRQDIKSRNGESMGYGVILNPNSTKLIIFLDGGGACFNGITCSLNAESFTENDFLTRLATENSLLINRTSENNQFKDWNFVFVPYATGDVHSGSNSNANVGNGGPASQTMVGADNITNILNDLSDYFDQQDNNLSEVVLTGSSAGGFGVFVNYPKVKSTIANNITTTAIVDAGQIFMDETLLTSCLVNQWQTVWDLDTTIPNDIDAFVQNDYTYNIQKVYEYLATKYPEDNFGFLSYKEDSTNSLFYTFGQNNCSYPPSVQLSGSAFSEGLLDLKTTVLDSYDNWKVFYKNGISHTFLSSPSFDQTINTTTLNDWIFQLRSGNASDLVE